MLPILVNKKSCFSFFWMDSKDKADTNKHSAYAVNFKKIMQETSLFYMNIIILLYIKIIYVKSVFSVQSHPNF